MCTISLIIDRWRREYKLMGSLDVIDGRWAASLEINPFPQSEDQSTVVQRPPLMLYDLWDDPYYGGSIHKERPDLVKKYTGFLNEEWKTYWSLVGIP
jgi:hypothetical protein